jgi:D-aminopeptidase
MIRGHQVGLKLVDWPHPEGDGEGKSEKSPGGSCMMIIATDAPLSSRQLARVATRSPLGLARTGFTSHATSGDYALAFSTTNRRSPDEKEIVRPVDRLVDEGVIMSMIFQAAVDATDEAVLNSIVAGKTLEGRDGHIAHAVPVDLINSMIFKNP